MTRAARLVGPALPTPAHPTVPAALRAAADSTATITLVDARESESVLSMRELYAGARRVAASLRERGVREGDRVALVLPTGRDFLDAFFGAQLAGAVPVPLYPPVRLGRMDEHVQSTARMMRAVGAAALVTDRRLGLLLGRVVEAARPALGWVTAAELRDTPREVEVATSEDALGVIQFSSGSTVDPKPVALSQRNLVAQCAALKALLPERDGAPHVGVSWLPLYHDMGLIGCLLAAVTFARPLVLIPPEVFLARPALWLRALSRHGGTVSPAPDFAYALCTKRARDEDLAGVDLSRWSYALDGAEPVSPRVLEEFARRFARYGFRREALTPVYGLAEASLALTFSASDRTERTLGVDARELALHGRVTRGDRAIVSVGRAAPGAEIEVRARDGEVAHEREVGVIYARAPFVMTGYFDRPEATAAALVDGWLDTGDLGFVEGGELFVCGRAKDVVILRGANHAPQEFEDCLDGIEGLRAGCAVAVGFVPSEGEGEQLLILAETKGDVGADLGARVAEAVAARTGVRPHTVRLLAPGSLPRTSSGKLRRGESLRRHLAGTLDAPEAVSALTVTREAARSALALARTALG